MKLHKTKQVAHYLTIFPLTQVQTSNKRLPLLDLELLIRHMKPKFNAQTLHQCIVSSLLVEPIKRHNWVVPDF
jgi:hypothetical protein